jgi:hypothetical protein
MGRLARFVVAALTAFALSCIILGVTYASECWECVRRHIFEWSGGCELQFKFSIAFAVIIGITAAVYRRRPDSGEQNAFAAIAAGAAVGVFYWYLSGRILSLQMPGHWPWGFLPLVYELPAASCWIAAGASAMLITIIRRPRTALIVTTILCLLAGLLPTPIADYVASNQELTVAVAIPADKNEMDLSDAIIGVRSQFDFDPPKVGAHIFELLQRAGIQGNYRVAVLKRTGSGKKSLQIIVINVPVTKDAELPEPDAGEIIYVEKADGWQKIPAQAPTLKRSVEVAGEGRNQDPIASVRIADAWGMVTTFGISAHPSNK